MKKPLASVVNIPAGDTPPPLLTTPKTAARLSAHYPIGTVECPSKQQVEGLSSSTHTVDKIEGKGEGVVALKDLAPGDVIHTEKALLKLRSHEVSFYRLEWMLSKLTENQRASYYNLHNCYTRDQDYFGPPLPHIIGVWSTNAFSLPNESHQVVLLGAGSKFNHSCRPNSDRFWCPKTDTWTFVATEPIKKGEEIFQAYGNVLDNCFNRRFRAITAWGFLCNCPTCSLPPELLEISDRRRLRLAQIWSNVSKRRTPSKTKFDQLIEALDLASAEGLHGYLYYLSEQCIRICAELDLQREVSEWASIVAEHLTYKQGSEHEEVLFLKRCIEYPWLYQQRIIANEGCFDSLLRNAQTLLDSITCT